MTREAEERDPGIEVDIANRLSITIAVK